MNPAVLRLLENRAGSGGDVLLTFSAPVERGSARGKDLGFPTANLDVEAGLVGDLEKGVFAARVRRQGAVEYGAVLNVGVRPTFGESDVVVEIHILDFAEDIYGETLEVTVLDKLRDERRFPDVQSLVRQIEKDIETARVVLQ